MSEIKTSEEVINEYRRILGNEFGEVYFLVRNEWIDIWVTWNQFESLFGHGPERIDLMNKAGASFFYLVQRHFFEAVLLAVCRLSDRTENGGKANLTVLRFKKFMNTPERQVKLKSLLGEVNTATQFARDWRNRMISHNDLDLKLGISKPLEEATRELVSKAIKSLHEVLAYISLNFMGIGFIDEVITGLNNEMVMLDRLFLGVMSYEDELNSFKRGMVLCLDRPKWLQYS
jgi:hypothetical protein